MSHSAGSLRARRSVAALFLMLGTLFALAVPAPAQTPEEPEPSGTEVPSLRSEYANVYQKPDGTLTAEISTRPVNYEKPDGTWAPIDPTLTPTVEAGYGWRNVGGPLELRFARVAGRTMASVESDGGSISFGLEDAALASLGIVTGNRITYASALPGVDLVYESKANALKELVVLDEAPKEAPSYRFLVSLQDLTPRAEKDGSISLLAADGKVELFIPAASMTDSKVDPTSSESAYSEDVELTLNREGNQYVLTVSPNLAWLQDPGRVYPVEIDPSVTLTPTLDTFVQTGITSGQSGSTELKAGTFDGGSTKARSFVKFSLSSILDKDIVSATFSLHEWHSWSCTASQVNAKRVTESWSSGVVWTNQPATGPNPIDTLNVAKGFSGSCPAGRINFDATTQVANWADGSSPNHGIMVRADDESANHGWKKFRSEEYDAGTSTDPKLDVTYNNYPTAVTSRSPANGTVTTDTTPTLSAIYNDPDAGDFGHVDYEICNQANCPGGSLVVAGSGTIGVNPGQASPWTLSGVSPQLLGSGKQYWWRARSDDGRAQSAWSVTWTYAPNQAPAVPTLDTPSASADVPMITPVLTATDGDSDPIHDADGNPLSYEFEVGTSGFSQILCASGWLPTTNTWTTAPSDCAFKDGATYYWRVRAKDAFQTSVWTSGRAFDIRLVKLGTGDHWPMWSLNELSVNQVNGNLVLSMPGPNYPTALGSMGASLTYNSLDERDRGLGVGWTLEAGDDLASPPSELIDHGLMEDGYDAVEIIVPGGDPTFFTQVGDSSTYISEPGDASQLTRNENGTWTLLDTDGSLYTFGAVDEETFVATLTSAERTSASSAGWGLTYTFSIIDPSRIISITDAAGRQLAFLWNSLTPTQCATAILCVQGPDGVTWKYIGDGGGGTSGRLVRINNGTRDLYAVMYEAGSSNLINKLQNANDLDPTNASPGYDGNHALVISYDGSGRVDEVSEGPITDQAPATSTWTLEYFPGFVQTPRTARSADGYATLTPPNQQGEPTPLKRTSYYDSRGREIETVDLFGNVTAVEYNERDQQIWSEDEEANRTDFTWDEQNLALLVETGPDPDGTGPLGRPVITYRYDEVNIGTGGQAGAALEGLQASYYANANLAGRPVIRKTDSSVDFSSAGGWPNLGGGQVTNFSVRWTGNVIVTNAGDYTFSTVATDGVRLAVDGVHAIEASDRVGPAMTSNSEPITLSAGPHRLLLEYLAKTTSGPEIELRWACNPPGCDQPVIPSSALQPAWMNPTSIVGPSGRISFSHFKDPASAQPDYSLVKLGDGTNLITSYEYDSAGRMIEKVAPKGNSARTIDSSGNLTGSPNLSYATTWAHYGLSEAVAPSPVCGGGEITQAGLPKSITRAGIAPTTTVYDAAGRAVAATSGSGVGCSSFDSEGRLTSSKAPISYGGSTYESITNSYDPSGARLTSSNGTLTNSIEYDEAGRAKIETDSFDAEVAYTYDAEGNVTARAATPAPLGSTYTTLYTYDAEGRLSGLTDPTDKEYAFMYDNRGQQKAVQYPNATFTWMDHNVAGWLTGLYHRHGTLSTPLPGSVPSDASPIADFMYSYDIEGRKTQELRTGAGLASETTSYSSYDALGRLEEVVFPDGTCRKYLFDLNSNRTQIKEGPSCGSVSPIETYTYSSTALDQLVLVTETGQPSRSFTYKAGGEVATRGSDDITWDGSGRHTGGTFGSATVGYGFDPEGFRRQRTAGSDTTRYLNGGLFEADGSGTVGLTDVDGPAGDLAHYGGLPVTSSGVVYLYYNGHGSLAAEANELGARIAAYTYDPFGALRSGSAPSNESSERFAGKWDKKLDATSGLIEMGARPYDPAAGRFYAVDPIEGGALNTYDYALQDPVNVYDLDGRLIWIPVAIVSARFVSLAAPIVARSLVRRFGARVVYAPSAQKTDLYHRIPHSVVKKVLRGGKRVVRSDGAVKYTGRAKFGRKRGVIEVIGRFQRNPDTGKPEFRVFHRFFRPIKPNLAES